MKLSSLTLILFTTFLLFSCAPQTKESYLEDYSDFITEIENDHSTYTKEDWQKADERYKKFSVEWKKDFEDDFIWKDHIQLTSFDSQYNLYKLKGNSSELVNELKNLFGNYSELKEKVIYYSDNEMEKHLEILRKEAKDLGDVATKTLEQILKELELEK